MQNSFHVVWIGQGLSTVLLDTKLSWLQRIFVTSSAGLWLSLSPRVWILPGDPVVHLMEGSQVLPFWAQSIAFTSFRDINQPAIQKPIKTYSKWFKMHDFFTFGHSAPSRIKTVHDLLHKLYSISLKIINLYIFKNTVISYIFEDLTIGPARCDRYLPFHWCQAQPIRQSTWIKMDQAWKKLMNFQPRYLMAFVDVCGIWQDAKTKLNFCHGTNHRDVADSLATDGP